MTKPSALPRHFLVRLAVTALVMLTLSCSSDSPVGSGNGGASFDYAAVSAAYCRDECAYANDGKCDELDLLCNPGTDCTDCGGRITGPACADTCRYAHDGMCDSPQLCSPGTDCSDCTGADAGMGGAGNAPGICANSCYFAGNGKCDEPAAGS